MRALIQRRDDAERQMQAGAAVADLRAGHHRRAVVETGGGCGAAGALRDVFIYLAIGVRAGAETLDRRHHHFRIQFLNPLPGEAHAVERARREIFDQHIALLDQRFQHFLAFRRFGVERHRTLVVIEHGEIQAVHAGDVAQLPARRVAFSGSLHLDHIGAEPGQQLRAGRSRLHMREIENADTVQGFTHVDCLRISLNEFMNFFVCIDKMRHKYAPGSTIYIGKIFWLYHL